MRRQLLKLRRSPGELIVLTSIPIVYMVMMGLMLTASMGVATVTLVRESPRDAEPDVAAFLAADEAVLLREDLVAEPDDWMTFATRRVPPPAWTSSSGSDALVIVGSDTAGIPAFVEVWTSANDDRADAALELTLMPAISKYRQAWQDHYAAKIPNASLVAHPFEVTVQRYESAPRPTQFDNTVAGILILSVLSATISRAAYAVAAERDTGLRARLLMTGSPRSSLLTGDLLHHVLVMTLQVAVLMLIAHFAYGAHVRGSMLLVVAILLMAGSAALAAGYIIGALSPTPRIASTTSALLTFPLMFLSGATVPLWAIPPAIRERTWWNPFKQANELLTGVIARGEKFTDLGAAIAQLALVALTLLAIAYWLVTRERTRGHAL